MPEARNEPRPDGITRGKHDDGYRACRLHKGANLRCRHREQDVDVRPHQLARYVGKQVRLLRRVEPIFYFEVLSLDVAQVAKSLTKRLYLFGKGLSRTMDHHA